MSGWIMSSGLVQGVVLRRIKGFFKKFASAVKGKVWPVLRPLLSTALSVIPGPASLIASRLLTAHPIITVDVDGEAKSTAALGLSTDEGADKFEVLI